MSVKGTGHNKDVIVRNIYKPPKDNSNIENINTFKTVIENVIHELDIGRFLLLFTLTKFIKS